MIDMESARLAFVATQDSEAQARARALERAYDAVEVEAADVIVALGGDGLMLQTLHRVMSSGTPIFGMNFGRVGFLMNRFSEENLRKRIGTAREARIRPLRLEAYCADGVRTQALAINEISLLRRTAQAARLEISVDGKVRLSELICDGVLLATPSGSTAYNLSVHGPILPLQADLFALTPISPFRPRRWRGALLPKDARVDIKLCEPQKRPVIVAADYTDFHDIIATTITQDTQHELCMLFDDDHSLEERILAEAFAP